MKFSLMMLLIALTMCGCKYYAIRSGDVFGGAEFTVVPTETISGISKRQGPYEYSATVAVSVNLPQKVPYRQFAERVISDAVYRSIIPASERREAVRQDLSSISGIVDYFFRAYLADDEAVRNDNWYLELKGDLMLISKEYMSYRAYVREDQHVPLGHGWYVNGTWSKALGRRLRREDLLNTKDYAKVGEIIARAVVSDKSNTECSKSKCEGVLARDWPSPSPEALVTENFMLVKGGVIWTYNSGEYWSYSEGFTDAFVPYSLLEPYLRDKTLVKEYDRPERDSADARAALDYYEKCWFLRH